MENINRNCYSVVTRWADDDMCIKYEQFFLLVTFYNMPMTVLAPQIEEYLTPHFQIEAYFTGRSTTL